MSTTLPKLDTNLNFIQALTDTPNDQLSAAQLKAEFDKAGNAIQTYLNTVQWPILSQIVQNYTSGAITTSGIANEAVKEAKIAPNAVTEDKIYAGAVTETKIANEAVTNAKLGAKAVKQANIDDAAVGTAQIINGNVTKEKVNFIRYSANGMSSSDDTKVPTSKLVVEWVGKTSSISADSTGVPTVTAVKNYTSSYVTGVMNKNATGVTTADDKVPTCKAVQTYVASAISNATIATSKLSGQITNAQLAGSISYDKLAGNIPMAKVNFVATSVNNNDTSVPTGKAVQTYVSSAISNASISTSKLSGTITNAQLAGSITCDKLADGCVYIAGTSAPANAYRGKVLWIDTNANGGLKYWNNSAWVAVPVLYS